MIPRLTSLTAAGEILSAMRTVATVNGAQAMTMVDRTCLESAWTVFFAQLDPLNLDFLANRTPSELAANLPDPQDRHLCAQALAVIPFIDGQLSIDKTNLVTHFVEALGITVDYLTSFRKLTQHHLNAALFCMIRENVISIHHGPLADYHGFDDGALAYFLPYRTAPDPILEARHEALANLPAGTLGAHYHAWYKRNQFPFPGDPNGLCPEFAWPHDTAHLLSGYNTTPHGEILVSTFTAGMHPDNAVEAHILPVLFSWHLGIKLNSVAKEAVNNFDPELFWEAWTRGQETTTDVFGPDWDFWAACERPLDELRTAYGVTPSRFDPARTTA